MLNTFIILLLQKKLFSYTLVAMEEREGYKFKAEVWIYPGVSAWHFVSLPKELAKEIKQKFGEKHRGWTSLPLEVKLGRSVWKTSMFRDKRNETYILPLKAEVRRREGIFASDKVEISINILI